MTSSERRRIEADYGEPVDARLTIAQCAAGVLVLLVIAGAGLLSGAPEDPVRATLSAPRVAIGR